MLCFERYYFRINGFVSLSILLTESDDGEEAEIVSFGAAGGVIDISYGAYKSSVKDIAAQLTKYGFVQQE